MRPTPPDPRRWKALALLCTAFFMVILDSAIVVVALPSIDADLAFSAGDLQWVLSAYLLSFGGLLLLGGRAADLLGRRRMFIAGAALFALASLGAGLSGTSGALLAARAVQGVAAAIMTPDRAVDRDDHLPGGRRAQQGARDLGLDGRHRRDRGVARGRPDHRRPRLGVDLLHQRARRRRGGRAEPGAPAREPRSDRAAALRPPGRGDDHGRAGGAGLRGRRGPGGRLGERPDAGPAGARGRADRGLRRIESRSVAPLAPLGVFRSRSLVGGNLVLFALGTMAFGVPFILTQYAQEVLGWSPIQFGLASVVMPLTAVIGTATAQALATRGGVRRVAVVAMALTGVGSLLLTQVSVGGSYLGDLFFALLFLGPGVGAAYVAGSIASLTGVAETDAGLASGLNNASFQIGGAVGVAILSTVAVSARARRRPARGAHRRLPVRLRRRDRRRRARGGGRDRVARPAPRARARCRGRAGRRVAEPNEKRRNVMQLENMPPVVSPQEWQAAWEQMLVKEKAQTRARDALAAERRRMPRMAVDRPYAFEGPDGPASLLDLFAGRRQLIVYRFFFEPGVADWPEGGCRGCSVVAGDQVSHLAHLNARDTTLVFVSRAPQPDIERWKARMGWEQIPWYTLTDDFDADFGVDELHGTNAFFHDGERIFRTYFIHERGDEALGSTWAYLDMTALGRQEAWEDSPDGYPQTPRGDAGPAPGHGNWGPYLWWNLHDEYDAPA